RLNLSEDQIAKIQELREAYLKDTLESRNEVMVKRFQQRDLLRDPQSNPNEIMAMQRDISNLESRIQERALVFQLEVRKILTPAQVQLLPPGGGMGFGGMGMGRGRGMGRGF
ncbi:MAG TPA: hypothetical protein VLS90_08465, partial [Thermodesulfobacteriota bacterium]|nr:hypothetical protein [Thermodesulfobacteriota bacterium]